MLGTGFFVFFGWLSDKIGRKPIIMAGCLIAAIAYFPLFGQLTTYANPALEKALDTVEGRGFGRSGRVLETCSTRWAPACSPAACDVARDFLAKNSIRYTDGHRTRRQPGQDRDQRPANSRRFDPTGRRRSPRRPGRDWDKAMLGGLQAARCYPSRAMPASSRCRARST